MIAYAYEFYYAITETHVIDDPMTSSNLISKRSGGGACRLLPIEDYQGG